MSCADLTNGRLNIVLKGRIDANSAPKLKDEIKDFSGKQVDTLVFNAKELEYISSAGLRVIVYAMQTIAADAKKYFVGANVEIKELLDLVGFNEFLEICDEMP